MFNNSFFNHTVFLEPGCQWPDQKGMGYGPDVPFRDPLGLGKIRHHAFAFGFFGFHYIRATIENTPSLKKESFEHLTKLLKILLMNETFAKNLNISKIRSLPIFQERIIKRVSLELGDHFCPTVQWIVEFGFHLALVRSFLVTAANCQSHHSLKSYLKFTELRVSHLLYLAHKSEIPTAITDLLTRSAAVLRRFKTQASALKSCELLGLAADNLLVTETAVKLLN